ncbi:MAG TPA: hypothetical protein VF631_07740 [Allosphingosinicella sp.]|jgi:hypothetical protein|uniref:hypothetical protein n=1 Tax=Allosphingosinicella sp. TaxID=2823234 RepID=UPI002F27D42B
MRTDKPIKRVFIASVNQEGRTEGDERYLELRAKINALQLEDDLDRWIAEYKSPGLDSQGWRTIIDRCIRELHESDLMIVLLFRRLGSQVEIDDLGPSPVTYLEIELFHASLRRIPVIFFRADDFVPSDQLGAMLRLLERVTDPRQWVTESERNVERRVIEVLRHIAKEGQLPPDLRGFRDGLSDDRSFLRWKEEVASSRLSFLSGYRPGAQGPLSLPRVDLLLREANLTGKGGESTFVDRLSRLWLALRELAQLPAEDVDQTTAVRWIRLCELWTSSAAWLRLHGPLELGVLATFHTRVDLRNRGFIVESDFPYGAYASEAYSIAKYSEQPSWQRRRFQASRRLATKQIELQSADPSGAFGIRASATMQLAQLGRPWLVPQALLDYRAMWRTRRKLHASDSEIGEALVELAYAEFMVGRHLPWLRNQSLAKLREGVALMEADRPHLRPGFVKRAKLKLANALAAAGKLDEAEVQRTELTALARTHGLPLD